MVSSAYWYKTPPSKNLFMWRVYLAIAWISLIYFYIIGIKYELKKIKLIKNKNTKLIAYIIFFIFVIAILGYFILNILFVIMTFGLKIFIEGLSEGLL